MLGVLMSNIGKNIVVLEKKIRQLFQVIRCHLHLPVKCMVKIGIVALHVFLLFLVRVYKSTESYCCHFDISMSVSVGIIQSTLVISKSKGPAETLRDIRTSTYQMCRIEENTKRTTKFHT